MPINAKPASQAADAKPAQTEAQQEIPKPEDKAKHEPPKRDQVAVTGLRKVHTVLDRARRDWTAIIAQSKTNINTAGSRFESDIEAEMLNGNLFDEHVVKLEQKFLARLPFTDTEIKEGAEWAKRLQELIKETGKKVTALKSWLVFPVASP